MRDPAARFIVSAITRAGIAEDLNEHLESHEIEQVIAEDDDRLTDEICEAYAEALGEIDPDFADFEEEQAEAIDVALRAMGINIIYEDLDE